MTNGDMFVARQPIFDRGRRVKGYELLFRRSPENRARVSCDRTATSQVISASYLDIGIQELTAGLPAFINFSKDLLVDGTAGVLEPKQVVIEVLEDVTDDTEVIDSILALKRQGYRIALDDISGLNSSSALIPLADILKVDLLAVPANQVVRLIDKIRSRASPNAVLLAEKVETYSQLSDAKLQGFDLFQGFFFSKPEVIQSPRIPESKISHLKLLQTFQSMSITFSEMEDIIKSDVGLTTKLLKYINAAAFPWARRIKSVRHALVLLGEMNIRKWIALVALSELSSEKPRELAIVSSCRGRFCELAGQITGTSPHTELEHFLLGALSTLDAMLNVPMECALRSIPISEAVKGALCGEKNILRDLLDMTASYEKGDWTTLGELCHRMNLTESSLPKIYHDALLWSDRVLRL